MTGELWAIALVVLVPVFPVLWRLIYELMGRDRPQDRKEVL